MVQHSLYGGGALLLGQVLVRPFAGIKADQVMELVAVRPGGFDKAGVLKAFQGGFRAAVRPAGQGGGCGGGVGCLLYTT
ncbi:hypothetical protein E1295_47495, partial [Nonomuraea mesophila]